MHDQRILKIPPFRALTRRAFRKESSTTRAGFFLFDMEISDDGLFIQAMPAFRAKFQNLVREGSDELRKKIFNEITAKTRLGGVIDPFHTRAILWKEHAENVGKDFLKAFDEIVEPYCGSISDASRGILYDILFRMYRGITRNRENEITRIIAAIGYPLRPFEPIAIPVRGFYANSQSKYTRLLDEKILEHNLKVESLKRYQDAPLAGKIDVSTKSSNEESREPETITRQTYVKRCREECKRREMKKGETISREGKYDIAKTIKLKNLGSLKSFKSGSKSYHRISRILSEIGYSSKPSKDRL